jgi:predicted MFS family arabinose efflux permease
VLGTTILNVPIGDIATDLHVSIASITLLVTAQAIAFGAFLPLGAWVGGRFGRKRVYCTALVTLGVTGVAAIFAPNLPALVALRIVQGLASATIVPLVMTQLSELYEPERRPLALSAWAIANSLAQALGPPLGGLLAVTLGWRSLFGAPAVVAIFALAAAVRTVPADPPRPQPLEWRGALGLTAGVILVLVAVSAVPANGIASPLVIGTALGGIAALALFARAIRSAPHPFVSPQAFREPSYLGACAGVFGATLCMGAALLAIPLYLERGLGLATDRAGYVTFALPLAMAVTAPLTSVVVRRFGSIGAVRIGLGTLIVASVAIAVVVGAHLGFVPLLPFLFALGAVVAMHYTAGAVGTTGTAAGRYGAGIGLFNALRVSGLAVGAALVGTILQRDPNGYATIFAGAAAAAVLSLAFVLLLREPAPESAV